ncbi:deaminase domain-containing protein [Clostridium sp. BJN0001]|uniref:deaminase domain-containing protein n=1 Tax=Clostridium sp. BJN0001 TaxID=2930219 RepID=UPI001FD58671|nr:deaminase domain-containing protein [Clostridium sp. BJN0001]
MQHNKIKIRNVVDFENMMKEDKTHIDQKIIKIIEESLKNSETEYRAYDSSDFIDYFKKKILFKEQIKILNNLLLKVENIIIKRIEYEKIRVKAYDVSYFEKMVSKAHEDILSIKDSHITFDIDELDSEISTKCVYAKDVELLKKILLFNNSDVKEKYDYEKRQKTLFIKKPDLFTIDFIKFKNGSIEYHNFLNDAVLRMNRLILNIKKYVKNEDSNIIEINQSKAIQDSINVAEVEFCSINFKALSGNDEVNGFIKAPIKDLERFKSFRVNRFGEIGTGYDRFCDSEKKIFEKIDECIENNIVLNYGKVILKSRWQPCPSCYYVMEQFLEKHPNMKIEVRYLNDYGRAK